MSVVRELAKILDKRAHKERDIVPRKVLRRDRDGVQITQALDGECEERVVGNDQVGQVNLLPDTSPFGNRGFAGLASLTSGTGLAYVERQEPRHLTHGRQTVTLHGDNLSDGMDLAYLRRDFTPDPDIEVVARQLVDRQTLRVEVVVKVDQGWEANLPLRYGARGLHRTRFYDRGGRAYRALVVDPNASDHIWILSYADGHYLGLVGDVDFSDGRHVISFATQPVIGVDGLADGLLLGRVGGGGMVLTYLNLEDGSHVDSDPIAEWTGLGSSSLHIAPPHVYGLGVAISPVAPPGRRWDRLLRFDLPNLDGKLELGLIDTSLGADPRAFGNVWTDDRVRLIQRNLAPDPDVFAGMDHIFLDEQVPQTGTTGDELLPGAVPFGGAGAGDGWVALQQEPGGPLTLVSVGASGAGSDLGFDDGWQVQSGRVIAARDGADDWFALVAVPAAGSRLHVAAVRRTAGPELPPLVEIETEPVATALVLNDAAEESWPSAFVPWFRS